ncbi:hypothetical protein MAR_008183 [Mya arenaria]|uniref:CASP-like protein n=1 Tax=Mya arenaria TaxID=6604 RepID=A0ABY7DV94_MYAAR|nr:hypothetical protein MAR_008183 [Mya arenaria]
MAGKDNTHNAFTGNATTTGEKAVEKSVLKYRVMACLALAFQIFATILTLLARVPKANFKQYLFTFTGICGLCLFLSALFSLVTSGMHVHQIIKAYKVYKKYIYLFEEMHFIFPYSLFCSASEE